MEESHRINPDYLKCHQVNGVYRAKMVDWMVEVLSTFKCADQTFFLAVSLLDRYLNALSQEKKQMELHELHITGVTCMFMASKYEDVYPLLMKTVFNKIGHKKISVDAIRTKELDILRAIGFMVGASPSPMEFLEKYIEEILNDNADKEFIQIMSIYLAKMSVHHETLCVLKPSLLGVSSIFVALKICEQMRQQTILTKEIFDNLVQVSGINEQKLIETSKKLLYLAQNFEKELPGLENLKGVYIPQLNKFV